MPFARTAPLREELEQALPDRPFTVRFWDGTELPATTGGGPTFTARAPAAVAHCLLAPGQLGLSRAYATGVLHVDDLDAVLRLLGTWEPPRIDRAARARLALAAVRACGISRPPRRPAAELRPRGERHSVSRDARAVRHHYDVSNEFFALFLDRSLTYSCGIFSRGATTLEEAQEEKLDMVCTKLGLKPGDRVLDVGCGWGSFAMTAAAHYGVEVVGITLSEPQAALASERVRQAGLSDLVQIRVADYRELQGETFDAIASIGMVEHVGEERIDLYARQLAGLLRPGGRLLNHGISTLSHAPAGAFSDRFVFPDAQPLQLWRVLKALEAAGFRADHIEGFPGDYSETLRHWARRLDTRLEDAVRLAGPERVRVWRLYLRAARNGFDTGFTSIYQANCRLHDAG